MFLFVSNEQFQFSNCCDVVWTVCCMQSYWMVLSCDNFSNPNRESISRKLFPSIWFF